MERACKGLNQAREMAIHTQYSKFAFISYSHRDMAVAKWLQRKLEGFRLPTEIHNDIDAKSRYIRPVFRDQTDLDTGVLSDELRRHLEESKFLILICSENSAKSQWVSDEAKAFVEMGRLDHIIPVIIPSAGIPERDLFPMYLREYFKKNPESELLGVNIGEVGKEKALIRVVSKMLGVSFDSLWKRHQRRKRMMIASCAAGATAALAAAYLFAIPVEVSVDVQLQKADLPMGETVTLNVDGGEYTSSAADPKFDRISIPGHKRFSDISVTVFSQFYETVDTVVPTGFGLRRDIDIFQRRDATFASFAGHVYDDDYQPLEGVSVTVAGEQVFTGPEGAFRITLPLQLQKVEHSITLEKGGYLTVTRDDEPPSSDIKFILHRQ